ncbi:MAG: TSUP family transporter [Acetobacteraceae bacterium]|nr:TSUP family transporter [Acetobacteraceae bacterium]
MSDILAHLALIFDGINIWAALGVTFVAGLMRGFAGFGSAMLMAPIFAMLFGSADMVVTVVAIELIVSFQLFPQVRQHADWKLLTPMSIAACAAMPLGVWLLANVDKNAIITAVSAVIVVRGDDGHHQRGRPARAALFALGQ